MRNSPLKTILIGLLLSAWTSFAPAQDVVPDPKLRIETGDHTGIILGLASSADGTHLATAAYDQTVRIWSIPKLEPTRTIRLPVGKGNEGAVYAVEFSPDGNTLITTGWTGAWAGVDGPWCFYVIDVKVGDMRKSVCDLPHRANHIAYSKDGKYFAFALKAGKGLRVYRTSDYSLAFEDRDYGSNSVWVEFDPTGRLVTSCYDGKIRLYDSNFKLIASRTMREGRRPDGVSFSPDGTQLAVAYDESIKSEERWHAAVDVISATDLTDLFSPDVRGVDNGALWRVVWSPDGKSLYAGGTWQKGNRFPFRRWADGGRGRPLDIPGPSNQIMRMTGISTGGLAFTSEVPYIGLIGPNDKLTTERRLKVADYTEVGDRLSVSRDGTAIRFAYEPSGAEPAYFSLLDRVIEKGDGPADIEMTSPVTNVPDLDVRNWSRSYEPTLNGIPLPLKTLEQALSLTFAADAKTLLLGTAWRIIRYDAEAKVLWSTQLPFAARGLVATADNRLVVAALGDGTIRWYAMDTGTELLAFFPHPDGARWVAWTPSGYFMSSVGGDSLVGWQVNRGRDNSADFFSVGRFRDKYYKPSIVVKTLAALDEAQAIREANAEGGREEKQRDFAELLPPVIEILEPQNGASINSPEVVLRYRLRAPSGEPINEVIIRSDDHPLGTFEAPPLGAGNEVIGERKIIVPQRDSEVVLFASNRFSTSEPASVRLKWTGEQAGIAAEKRKVYVLAIGVSEYANKKLKLSFPAKDASDFVSAVVQQKDKAFVDVVSKIITNQEATLEGMRSGLDWLTKMVGPTDIGMVFLAGHGLDTRDGIYYFLPRDANLSQLPNTALSYVELLSALKRIVGSRVLFVDTCRAGGIFGPGLVPMDVIGFVSQVSQPSMGVIVYASSTGKQNSLETAIWKNGAFTKAVVEGINGAAEYRDRDYITTSMLQTYVKERVRDLTANRQTPTVNMPLAVPDLLLARVQRSPPP
ncbi:caspase family protein [Hyphomicrobium sp.]|uniref:caspase family protein n=1 Tax=Hyphomicrobium sp. TaxID=82 RepID=UPI003F6EA041